MGTQGPPGQAHSSRSLAQLVLLLWATLGKRGKKTMSVSYKMNPSGKDCYCQVFSEAITNKEGENLSLTSGSSS